MIVAAALCALLASVTAQNSSPSTTTSSTTSTTSTSTTLPTTTLTVTTTTTTALQTPPSSFTNTLSTISSTTNTPSNSSTESTTTAPTEEITNSTRATTTTTKTTSTTTTSSSTYSTTLSGDSNTTATTIDPTTSESTSSSTLPTTSSTTLPRTPAPTTLPPVVWPEACSDDKCPNTTICVFRVPTNATRSPFTCFDGACNVNCKNVLANGGSCKLESDAPLNGTTGVDATTTNNSSSSSSVVLFCNSTNVVPVPTYPAVAPCSFNESAKCELCTPTLGTCDRNAGLGDFCTPYQPCSTPNTYCLSAGVVVTGSLRCLPLECAVCGGELAGCVVEVWNSTTAPVFSGCMSTKPGPVLVARAYAPSQVAVWRSARLDLARGFDSAAIVRDMERLAAVLGGYSEHVRVQNILASNDDSLGDPALLVVPGPGLSPAYQLSAVSVVFQMPAPMLYNLETLLLVPTSVAAQQLKAEFGIVGIERTDWIAPVPPADSASTTATSRWALATGVFVGLMLARNQ